MRERTPDDLPGCLAALREVHLASGYPSVWPDDPAGFLCPDQMVQAWVALNGTTIVGHVMLRSFNLDLEPPGWLEPTGLSPAQAALISRLYVVPQARGEGVATALLATAVRHAQTLGRRAVLDVAVTAHAAVRLYERLGWRRAATLPAPWRGPDGRAPAMHVYVAPEPSQI
ncbi:GNAT family N-acetyltransferase [Deinococcus sonorensis]|uniref:GNAT family N-acetyltransferase n=2 Tax=Deinococcus sonorensis TaxID=309891 RepID=A0AAU7UDQ8_9DEIO